jgi:hypothetical protein
VGSSIYVPWQWPVTQKSDVWAVGLAAQYLLWAGKGEDYCTELADQISGEIYNWPKTLNRKDIDKVSEEQCLLNETSISEYEHAYSIGLARLVRRCLRLRPQGRPTLREMKITIDANISRLDGLYGEEIKKRRGTIATGHGVLVDETSLQAFGIGARYDPPRKRRRIDTAEELGDEHAKFIDDYAALVNEWADTAEYPRPSLQQEAAVVAMMVHRLDTDLLEVEDGEILQHSFRYLVTCLQHRVDPTVPTPFVSSWDEDSSELVESFKASYKILLLKEIRDLVTEFLDDEDLEEYLHDIFYVLDHVVRWSYTVLQMNGEPVTPAMDDKTELHRGFLEWLFVHPHT